LVSLSLFILM